MLRRPSHRQRDELRALASRQAAVAEIGRRALASDDLDEILRAAVETARSELRTDYASVLELTSDGRSLHVRATAGFPDDMLGGVLRADAEELSRIALDRDEPLSIGDFSEEPDFVPSAVQRELGVTSALVAPIGISGRHFGVLGVYAREPRPYEAEDVNFIRALASTIGLAAERNHHESRVRDSEARFRELADTTPALMWMTDPDAHVTFVNEGWLRFTGRTLGEELGDTFGLSAHPDDRTELLSRAGATLSGAARSCASSTASCTLRPGPTAGCSRWEPRASPTVCSRATSGRRPTSTSGAPWRRRCASRRPASAISPTAPR